MKTVILAFVVGGHFALKNTYYYLQTVFTLIPLLLQGQAELGLQFDQVYL